MFKIQNLIVFVFLFTQSALSLNSSDKSNIIVGANQISKYENLIKNKRIGIVANHTSVIFKENDKHFKLPVKAAIQ